MDEVTKGVGRTRSVVLPQTTVRGSPADSPEKKLAALYACAPNTPVLGKGITDPFPPPSPPDYWNHQFSERSPVKLRPKLLGTNNLAPARSEQLASPTSAVADMFRLFFNEFGAGPSSRQVGCQTQGWMSQASFEIANQGRVLAEPETAPCRLAAGARENDHRG
jgi:hypothetical protein